MEPSRTGSSWLVQHPRPGTEVLALRKEPADQGGLVLRGTATSTTTTVAPVGPEPQPAPRWRSGRGAAGSWQKPPTSEPAPPMVDSGQRVPSTSRKALHDHPPQSVRAGRRLRRGVRPRGRPRAGP